MKNDENLLYLARLGKTGIQTDAVPHYGRNHILYFKKT